MTTTTRQRPFDLPDYTSPPVTEVALGVQFNAIERFMSPHFGFVFEAFGRQFPEIEEHAPLDPAFETFGDKASPAPMVQFQLLAKPPTPRIFLINADRTELLQIQRDRFYHNWRKIGDEGTYPRFERMIETFADGYSRFQDIVTREKLGQLVPNQCEIAYINQILVQNDHSPFEAFEEVFGSFSKSTIAADGLGKPEDARFMYRYIIRDDDNTPAGRLIVTAEPAWRADRTKIVQLTLVARGKPTTADFSGVQQFLTRGRRLIVSTFTELTSDQMHRKWGRKK